ncbi:MAG: DUF6261 family protein [Tannerella sp.]|jgi:hypothetical protein|nr:DUF6261 family protein [Tannerella sp.]
MKKFISLRVDRLKLDNLAGLCGESIHIVKPIISKFGSQLLQAAFDKLSVSNDVFDTLIDRSHRSPLTIEIKAIDKRCGEDFAELRRGLKFFEKSSIPAKANAAKLLMPLFRPLWNMMSEPIASQMMLLDTLNSRIAKQGPYFDALSTLQLGDTWQDLLVGSLQLQQAYTQRLQENADAARPSASSMKATLVKDYDLFCAVTENALEMIPSTDLEKMFHELNELRRKYAMRLPKDLNPDANTRIDSITPQQYTGQAITPIPTVYYREENQPEVELVFAKDYFLTYKNNVGVGTAFITIHGKGAYRGRRTTTFNIGRLSDDNSPNKWI